MRIWKNILAVIVGIITALILISAGEYIMQYMFPLPAGTNTKDSKALVAAFAHMPASAFIFLLINYMIASFMGGLVATLTSGRTKAIPALIIGVFLTVAGIAYNLQVPNPTWFAIISLLVYIPMAYGGFTTVRKPDTEIVEKAVKH